MKFELTAETIVSFGVTLRRIRALADFGPVRAGDVGGFIEKSENLSVYGDAQVYGNAWVSGDAQVCGDARVSGNAQVYGNARVSGNAQVYGNAWVSGNAQVCGNAWVYGNARVYGDARVSGNAWVSGNARVYGNAWVSGNAQVCGDARVSGNAQVYGNAWVSPIVLHGLHYPVTITDNHMRIGCEFHTLAEWEQFDDERIARMDGCCSRRFWVAMKPLLLGIARANGRTFSAVAAEAA